MSQRVPTTLITGFLGVGKTTAILELLKHKPEGEHWAVLVNEFGEVGIDGALMADSGALIKEVPGGCMCCAAGVPTTVALNTLLRQQPDRLLIEPTGLGHPKQILAILQSPQYQSYIELHASIALLDPRNLSDERYTRHDNFNDQLDCAEVIVGNKQDLCSVEDIAKFNRWVAQQTPKKLHSVLVQQGQIPLELLDLVSQDGRGVSPLSHHHHHPVSEFTLEQGEAYARKENQGDGYYSCGWLFDKRYQFAFDDLFTLFSQLSAERVKAVAYTNRGIYAFNLADDTVSVNEIDLAPEYSRLEVIDSQLMAWDKLEPYLLNIAGISSQQTN